MNLSQYFQTQIVNYLNGTDFPAAPAELKLALSSTEPCAGITEVGTRQTLTLDAPANGITHNSTPMVWADANGSVAYVAIFAGTDMLYCAPLPVPYVSTPASPFSLDAGDLTVGFDSSFTTTFAESLINWLRGTSMAQAPADVKLEISRGATFNPPHFSDNYTGESVTWVQPFVFTVGAGTTMENEDDILFQASHTTDWGVITHVALTDGSVNVNRALVMVPLAVPKTVEIGSSVGFGNNSIQLVVG